jgi:peptidoglycan/LPS O-acetylase OafA/YrhL
VIQGPGRIGDRVRLDVLDGWRGLSVLFVLVTHLLPLGPKVLGINMTTGPLGMALFFTLSGFLITNFLIHRPNVTDFLIHRLARIVPLAWVCLVIALYWVDASPEMWAANFFFYSNWPPTQLPSVLTPFWSLCVEMQFYVGIALLVVLLRRHGLMLLPLFCVAVTLFRVMNGAHVDIATYLRVDEILAGCTLALVYNNMLGTVIQQSINRLNPYILCVALIVSCHPASGWLNYLRPYLAAMLVGWSLLNPNARMCRWLCNRTIVYVATVSYALYVIHPLLVHSWLGSGDVIEKYAKRPLLLAILFLLAHVSTFYFEHRCIAWGKRLAARIPRR